MKYNAPFGAANPDAPYINGNPSIGVAGSIPPAESIEYPQREIVKAITDAGMVPANDDLGQLSKAIRQTSRKSWIPVKSITLTTPPSAENNTFGDTYVIPQGAKGDWADEVGLLAEWTGQSWNFYKTPNGHGIGLPDGSIYIKINGVYTLSTDLLDKRYAKFPEPPATTFYVVGPTGNDKNTGLKPTPADGFATIQGAVDALSKYMTASTITIIVSPGTYESVNVSVSHVASWSFVGNPDNPDAVKIYAKNESGKSSCFALDQGCVAMVNGFSLFGVTGCVSTTSGNVKVANCDVTISAGGRGFEVYDGSMFVSGKIHVSGSGDAVFLAADTGTLSVGFENSFGKNICNVTFKNVSCATAVFFARTCATLTVAAPVVTFSYEKAPNGVAWIASDNAILNAYGGGKYFLPGSAPGYTQKGGQSDLN